MSKVFDFLPDGLFPLALQFSKANLSAGAANSLTLAQGNGFVVPPDYVFHPLALSAILNALPTAEKTTNGGFETAGGGTPDIFGTWTEAAGNGALAQESGAGNFHGGAKSCKLTVGADTACSLSQDIVVVAGRTYALTFWVKGDGTTATHKARYQIIDATNSADIVEIKSVPTASAAFYKVTETFVAPATCESVTIKLAGAALEGAVCYLDDVSVLCTISESTCEFGIAVDGTLLTEGPEINVTEILDQGFKDAHMDFYPITAGKEITVVGTTTAAFLPVTADADAILFGVLKHA